MSTPIPSLKTSEFCNAARNSAFSAATFSVCALAKAIATGSRFAKHASMRSTAASKV